MSKRPSSWATFAAYWRQGLQTLQDFFVHPFPDSRQITPTPGTATQPTPIEVYDANYSLSPSPVDAYAEQLRLKDLVARRRQLLHMRTQELNRAQQATQQDVAKSIKHLISALDREVANI